MREDVCLAIGVIAISSILFIGTQMCTTPSYVYTCTSGILGLMLDD
jgi:hypothetical protein